jgi:hypothetical protein
MDADKLIAQLEEQRTRWADLPGGKRVQFRRPLETEFHTFRAGVDVEHVAQYVCGWEKFTEADILGAAIGSDASVPFSGKLWDRVARDRLDYVAAVATAIVQAITDYLAQRDATAKN